MIIIFLEAYKKYKNNFNEDNLFEDTSIGKSPLFGADELLKEDYNNVIDIDTIINFNNEIEKTIQKLYFIKGFLTHYKEALIEKSILIDEEIQKINNSTSYKGSSFLQLKDRMLDYNYIFDVDLVHSKNIQIIGENIYKIEENSIPIPGYFSYPENDKIIFNFKEARKVNEIILETHKEISLSIYGETKDGNTIPIFLNISTNQKLFINTIKEEFTKLIFLSNGNLKSYLKSIFSYYKEFSTVFTKKNGYIFTKSKNKNIKNIILLSDDESDIYLLTKDEFELSIKEIHDNEKYVLDRFLTEKNKITKNTPILFENIKSEFYFVEKINKDTDRISEFKLYGKE